MKYLVALTLACVLYSCQNSSDYKNSVNEIPEPTPLPDTILVLNESTPDGAELDSMTDSVKVAFMTIGLGRGYGWYEVLFFRDEKQTDTIDISEVTTFYNSVSLRHTVRGSFAVAGVLAKRENPYFWRVWYRDGNIKSDLRSFYVM